MAHLLARFMKDTSGATAVEYGMVVALIAVAILGTIEAIGTDMGKVFGKISAEFRSAGS